MKLSNTMYGSQKSVLDNPNLFKKRGKFQQSKSSVSLTAFRSVFLMTSLSELLSFWNIDTHRAALVGSQQKRWANWKGEEKGKKGKTASRREQGKIKRSPKTEYLIKDVYKYSYSRMSMNIHLIFCTVAVDQDKVWIRGTKGKGESLCF